MLDWKKKKHWNKDFALFATLDFPEIFNPPFCMIFTRRTIHRQFQIFTRHCAQNNPDRFITSEDAIMRKGRRTFQNLLGEFSNPTEPRSSLFCEEHATVAERWGGGTDVRWGGLGRTYYRGEAQGWALVPFPLADSLSAQFHATENEASKHLSSAESPHSIPIDKVVSQAIYVLQHVDHSFAGLWLLWKTRWTGRMYLRLVREENYKYP